MLLLEEKKDKSHEMNIYPSKLKDRRKKVMVEIKAVTKPWF